MLIRTSADLGALIRERRTKLGLDQISLARLSGTSRKWLIEVENGKPRAEIGLVFRTLKALGIVLRESAVAADGPSKSAKFAAGGINIGAINTGAINIDRVIDSLKGRPIRKQPISLRPIKKHK
jgi:HTH-type transcriptional regulator/antitoxin HipB